MKIDITRRTASRALPSRPLRRIVLDALKLLHQPRDTQVSLLLTNDAEIHSLNRQWRHKDRPTDVLSFSMREGGGIPEQVVGGLLGDIVLSMETCERQAEEKGWSIQEECSFLILHGILHLLGYDHERDEDHVVMEARTQEIWAQLHPRVALVFGLEVQA